MKKGGGYPYLLTLNAADGTLVWGKRVDPHPAAMLTMSPTVHAGYIYQVCGLCMRNTRLPGQRLTNVDRTS